MSIKIVIEGLLKENKRPMRWLAKEMGKTPDGLRLSLTRGSIKYNDFLKMAKILGVNPAVFFQTEAVIYQNTGNENLLYEPKTEYAALKNCKEMVATLKDQLKDKEKIISLMGRAGN